MNKIVIAHGHTSLEVFHSLTPLLLASEETGDSISWKFVDYRIFNVFKMQGDLIILVRRYHDAKRGIKEIELELNTLKKNFTKVIYFDDSAATSAIWFNMFEFVDEYWKRSAFNNLDLYTKELYGGHLFSQYYHKNYNITDKDDSYFYQTSNSANLEKLKIAWNIGVGAFPTANNNLFNQQYAKIRRLFTGLSAMPTIKPVRWIVKHYMNAMKSELEKEINLKQKANRISGRFKSSIYRDSIGYQRVLMHDKIKNNKLFLTGEIDRWKFTEESFSVRGMLSPFGWGEVCYRDFEAALGGAVLIKPDMSHVNTWPNIFTDKSYIALSWDLDELDLIQLGEQSNDIVNAARKIYLDSLDSVVERAVQMVAL